MSSQAEHIITSGHLDFDSEGNLTRVTYVNPTTQELIISEVNPETGEISSPNTIDGELECDNNGDFIKLTYSFPSNSFPSDMSLVDGGSLQTSVENKSQSQNILYKCCPPPRVQQTPCP